MCFGENTESVTGQSLHKEITHNFHQPYHQKPEIEIGMNQQRHCKFELKMDEAR